MSVPVCDKLAGQEAAKVLIIEIGRSRALSARQGHRHVPSLASLKLVARRALSRGLHDIALAASRKRRVGDHDASLCTKDEPKSINLRHYRLIASFRLGSYQGVKQRL